MNLKTHHEIDKLWHKQYIIKLSKNLKHYEIEYSIMTYNIDKIRRKYNNNTKLPSSKLKAKTQSNILTLATLLAILVLPVYSINSNSINNIVKVDGIQNQTTNSTQQVQLSPISISSNQISNSTTPEPHYNFVQSIIKSFDSVMNIISEWLKQKNDRSKCTKGDLTSPVALVIQGILGLVAFLALVIKKICEPPEQQRTWLIWFLDSSKQGVGMVFMHVVNIYLSDNVEDTISDPCTFYLTSFLLDSSLGLLIIWCGLRSFSWLIQKFNILGGLPFGEYDPNFRTRNDNELHEEKINVREMDHSLSYDELNNETSVENVESSRRYRVEKTKSDSSYNELECSFHSFNNGNETDPLNRTGVNDTFIKTKSSRNHINSVNQQVADTIRQIEINNSQLSLIQNHCANCLSDNPPISPSVWILQCAIYLFVTIVEKIAIFYVLQIEEMQSFYAEMRALLTEMIEVKIIELALVLFIVPFILNCLMFWVIDNILMKGMSCVSSISTNLSKMSCSLFYIILKFIRDLFQKCSCTCCTNCCDRILNCEKRNETNQEISISNQNSRPVNTSTTSVQAVDQLDCVDENLVHPDPVGVLCGRDESSNRLVRSVGS